MQSRPIDLSQEQLHCSTQQNSNRPTQHGFSHNHDRVPRYLPDGDTSRNSASFTFAAGVPPSPSSSGGSSAGSPSWRLSNEVARQISPPVDRIAQYEERLIISPRRTNDGPEFRLVPKSKKSGHDTCTILDFPNGKLTISVIPTY